MAESSVQVAIIGILALIAVLGLLWLSTRKVSLTTPLFYQSLYGDTVYFVDDQGRQTWIPPPANDEAIEDLPDS